MFTGKERLISGGKGAVTVACLFLAVMLSPVQVRADHWGGDPGGIPTYDCYDCHFMGNADLAEPDTSYLNISARTMVTMRSLGWSPNAPNESGSPHNQVGCTYCHSSIINTPTSVDGTSGTGLSGGMLGALQDFEGTHASLHPIKVSGGGEPAQEQYYYYLSAATPSLDPATYAADNLLACTDCHDPALARYPEPDNAITYGDDGHARGASYQASIILRYRLRNVSSDGDYPNRFCDQTCHDGSTVRAGITLSPMYHRSNSGYTSTDNVIYETVRSTSPGSVGMMVQGDPVRANTTVSTAADCAVCHDAHSSSEKGLISDGTTRSREDDGSSEEALDPGSCTSCHVGGQAADAFEMGGHGLDSGPRLRCVACHDDALTHAEARAASNPGRFLYPEGSETTGGTVGAYLGESRDSICQTCHQDWESHYGPTGFSLSCLECHEPHGKGVGGNSKMIRQYVNGEAVSYTTSPFKTVDDSSAGDLYRVDGQGVCDNVSCHGNPLSTIFADEQSHPKVSGTAPDTGTYCNDCHAHQVDSSDVSQSKGGWVEVEGEQLQSCGGCHGTPPVTTNMGSNRSQANRSTPETTDDYYPALGGIDEGYGPHDMHQGAGRYQYDCQVCHDYNYILHPSNSPFGSEPFPYNSYQDVFYSSLGKYPLSAATYDTATASCGTVYCHSSGEVIDGGGGAVPVSRQAPLFYDTIAWTAETWMPAMADTAATPIPDSNNLDCGACHGGDLSHTDGKINVDTGAVTGSVNSIATLVHPAHIGTPYEITCDACHASAVSYDAGDQRRYSYLPAQHADGDNDVSMGGGALYDATYGTCSGSWCHGQDTVEEGASQGLKYAASRGWVSGTSPQWNLVSSGACGSCHLVSSFTDAHQRHLDPALMSPVPGCESCHPADPDGNFGDAYYRRVEHVDGVVNVRTLAGAATTLGGSDVCDNCHGGGASAARAWWGSAPGSWESSEPVGYCNSCHDGSANSAYDGGGIFAPDVAQFYASAGHGRAQTFAATGSPAADYGCLVCHRSGRLHLDGLDGGSVAARLATVTVPATGYADTVSELCQECHAVSSGPFDDGSGVYSDDLQAVPSGQVDATREVTLHSSSVSGNYGSIAAYGYQCADCHDPHGSANLAMVASVIDGTLTGGTAEAVSLTGSDLSGLDPHEGLGSMNAAGFGTFGPCEACHGAVQSHPDAFKFPDGEEYAEGNHKIGADCSACHQHSSGFAGASCNSCHGYPPMSNQLEVDGYAAGYGPAFDESTTPHLKHIQVGAACEDCHYFGHLEQPAGSHEDGQFRSIWFDSAFNPSVTDTTFVLGQWGGDYDPSSFTCSNLYCHSDGSSLSAVGSVSWALSPSEGAPRTGNVLGCDGCHNAGSAMVRERHGVHMSDVYSSEANRGTDAMGCDECHALTTSDNVSIASTALHVMNRSSDVSLSLTELFGWDGSSVYSSASRTCSQVLCHSNGQFYPASYGAQAGYLITAGDGGSGQGRYAEDLDGTLQPDWDVVNPDGDGSSCNNCHGTGGLSGAPDYANAGTGLGANSHSGSTHAAAGCYACHQATVSTGSTVVDGYAHVNGVENVSFYAGTVNGRAMGDLSWDPATKSCSGASNDCHTSSIQWGGTGGCTTCHGMPPQTSSAGGPDGYATGYGPAFDESLTPHLKHADGGAGYGFDCLTCHYYGNGSGEPSHQQGSFQSVYFDPSVNSQASTLFVAGQPGADYDSVSHSCSNLYCHSDGSSLSAVGSASWGDSPAAYALDCGGCHGFGTGMDSLAHAAHLTSWSTDGSRGAGVMGCDECHDGTTADGVTIGNRSLHVLNRTSDVSISTTELYGSDGTPVYQDATASCAQVLCHSRGEQSRWGGGSPSWAGTVQWSASLTCSGCHDVRPASGGHAAHLDTTLFAPDLECGACHPADGDGEYVNSYGSATHVDGTVQFADGTFLGDSAGAYGSTTHGTNACDGCHGTALSSGQAKGYWYSPGAWASAGGYCQSCHDASPGSWDGATGANVFASWSVAGNGGHGMSAVNTYTASSAAGPAYWCDVCHDFGALHLNGAAAGNGRLLAVTGEGLAYVGTVSDLCMDCHDPEQSSPGSLGHDSTLGASVHSGGVSGKYNTEGLAPEAYPSYGMDGNYAQFPGYGCEACHDPHGTGNIAMILGTVDGNLGNPAQSNPVTVSVSSLSQLDPSAAADDGVCDACHKSAASAHPDTGSEANNHNYTDTQGGRYCVGCHDHGESFKGAGGACGTCHFGSKAAERESALVLAASKACVIATDWDVDGHGTANGGLDCAACHLTYGTSGHGMGLSVSNPYKLRGSDNGVCLSCHASAADGGVSLDNEGGPLSGSTNSSVSVSTAHWGVDHAGNDGGAWCWDCHNPHGNGSFTSNSMMLWRYPSAASSGTTGVPATLSSYPQVFTVEHAALGGATGTDFADASVSARAETGYNGVCQVCHTDDASLLYHVLDVPAKNGHYNSPSGDNQSCLGCHTHRGGFAADSGCTGCHGGSSKSAERETPAEGEVGKLKIITADFISDGHGTTGWGFGVDLDVNCLYCHLTDSDGHPDTTLDAVNNPYRLRTYGPGNPTNQVCLECHEIDGLQMTLDSDSNPLPAVSCDLSFVSSAHAGDKHTEGTDGGAWCWDCHTPHGTGTFTGNSMLLWDRPSRVSDSVNGMPSVLSSVSATFTLEYADLGTTSDVGSAYAESLNSISANGEYNGICQVCHTGTNHHRADGTLNDHYNDPAGEYNVTDQSCVNCHSHNTGMAAPALGCAGCHGYPPQEGDGKDHYSQGGDGTHITPYANAHVPSNIDSTSDGYPGKCVACHDGSHNMNRTVAIALGNLDVVFPAGSLGTLYPGKVIDSLSAYGATPMYNGSPVAFGNSSQNGYKTCSNISCHAGKETPAWDGTLKVDHVPPAVTQTYVWADAASYWAWYLSSQGVPSASTTVPEGTEEVFISATFDDSASGGFNVVLGEYTVQSVAGTGTMVNTFGRPTVYAYAPVDVSGWSNGTSRQVNFYASDEKGNWSNGSQYVTVNVGAPPRDELTVTVAASGPGTADVSSSPERVEMLTATLSVTASGGDGTVWVDRVKVDRPDVAGCLQSVEDVALVRVYLDSDSSGTFDPATDTQLGASILTDAATDYADIDILDLEVVSGTDETIFIACDLAVEARPVQLSLPSDTAYFTLAGSSDAVVSVTGATSGKPYRMPAAYYHSGVLPASYRGLDIWDPVTMSHDLYHASAATVAVVLVAPDNGVASVEWFDDSGFASLGSGTLQQVKGDAAPYIYMQELAAPAYNGLATLRAAVGSTTIEQLVTLGTAAGGITLYRDSSYFLQYFEDANSFAPNDTLYIYVNDPLNATKNGVQAAVTVYNLAGSVMTSASGIPVVLRKGDTTQLLFSLALGGGYTEGDWYYVRSSLAVGDAKQASIQFRVSTDTASGGGNPVINFESESPSLSNFKVNGQYEAWVPQGTDSVSVTAAVSDKYTGGSCVTYAECFLGADPGPGNAAMMSGTYGSTVAADLTAMVDTSALTTGDYTVSVRGRDACGNWSDTFSATLHVMEPNTVTVTGESLVPAHIAAGMQYVPLMRLRYNLDVGYADLATLRIHNTGTIPDADVSLVRAFIDNGNGYFDRGDYQVGSARFGHGDAAGYATIPISYPSGWNDEQIERLRLCYCRTVLLYVVCDIGIAAESGSVNLGVELAGESDYTVSWREGDVPPVKEVMGAAIASSVRPVNTMSCGWCHGLPPLASAQGAPDSSEDKIAGSHIEHSNADDDYTDCNDCHSAGGTIDVNLFGPDHHNGYIETVTFPDDLGSYSDTTDNGISDGTCLGLSETRCHPAGQVPVWDYPIDHPGEHQFDCVDCHVGTGDVENYVYADGVVSQIDSLQWYTVGHGLDTTERAGMTCEECHNTQVIHGQADNYFRVKADYAEDETGLCAQCHDIEEVNVHSNQVTHTTEYGDYRIACIDCHDMHGDSNLHSIHDVVVLSRDVMGIPTATYQVTYTAAYGPGSLDPALGGGDGLCDVCHTNLSHTTNNSTATDTVKHAQGGRCDGCHGHELGFMQGSCVSCHDSGGEGVKSSNPVDDDYSPTWRRPTRQDFEKPAHHIANQPSDEQCAVCHEKDKHQLGTVVLIDPDVGASLLYTYDRHSYPTTSAVDTAYANARLALFCLNCHDSDGALNAPNIDPAFSALDPFGDGVLPKDIMGAVANSATTNYSKYDNSSYNVVPRIVKSYSPHFYPDDNVTKGTDLPVSSDSLKQELVNAGVQRCFDCHPFNDNDNNTHGGDYYLKGDDRVGTINASILKAEPELCWDCHDDLNNGWGILDYYGDTGDDMSGSRSRSVYDQSKHWGGADKSAVWQNSPFAYKDASIQSKHVVQGSDAIKTDQGQVTCSNCHDPHGLDPAGNDPATGMNQFSVPILRGTWLTSPYLEDRPGDCSTMPAKDSTTAAMYDYIGNVTGFSGYEGNIVNDTYSYNVPRANPDLNYNTPPVVGRGYDTFNSPANTAAHGHDGFFIDDNTWGGTVVNVPAAFPDVPLNSGGSASVTASIFGGLCSKCHGGSVSGMQTQLLGASVLHGTVKEWTSSMDMFKSSWALGIGTYPCPQSMHGMRYYAVDKSSVCGNADASGTPQGTLNSSSLFAHNYRWGVDAGAQATANYAQEYHSFTCSKCHTPHASRLPKLMVTNCLESGRNNAKWRWATGGALGVDSRAMSCHSEDWSASPWNAWTPWYADQGPNVGDTTDTTGIFTGYNW